MKTIERKVKKRHRRKEKGKNEHHLGYTDNEREKFGGQFGRSSRIATGIWPCDVDET